MISEETKELLPEIISGMTHEELCEVVLMLYVKVIELENIVEQIMPTVN